DTGTIGTGIGKIGFGIEQIFGTRIDQDERRRREYRREREGADNGDTDNRNHRDDDQPQLPAKQAGHGAKVDVRFVHSSTSHSINLDLATNGSEAKTISAIAL